MQIRRDIQIETQLAPNWTMAFLMRSASNKLAPIIRIFDEAQAREFYCRFHGLEIAFEHRHEGQLPFYIGVERAGALLHLTEHHDDASPGSNVFLSTQNIRLFHRELLDKQYSFGSPDLEELPWSLQI